MPQQVGHDGAHVDDRALLEALHGLFLEVGHVVVEAPAIHVLATVEVDHVEAAVVEDPRDALGDLVHQVRLLVNDVAVDAAVHAKVNAGVPGLVRRGGGPPRAALAAEEGVPLPLRADALVLDDLVTEEDLAVLLNAALPVPIGRLGAACPIAEIAGHADFGLVCTHILCQLGLELAPESLVGDGSHIGIALRDLGDEGVHADEDSVLVELVHDALEALDSVGASVLAEGVVPHGLAPRA